MKRAIDDPQYPWFEKLDEETAAEKLRTQEFHRQWGKAHAVLKKYKKRKGWDQPSLEMEFDHLVAVHSMGREEF